MYSLFQCAAAATAILQAIMLRQKGILILLQGETLTTIMMHIANALPAAPHSLTATVRNADIPMLIKDGWVKNINHEMLQKTTNAVIIPRNFHTQYWTVNSN